MKKVIILMGCPASGKSTLAKRLEIYGFTRVNADGIREELYGSEQEQGDYQEVFDIVFDRIQIALLENKSIVVDNTNLNLSYLYNLQQHINLWGTHTIELWLMDVSLEILLERNKNRFKRVPEDTILMFFNKLESFKYDILSQVNRVINEDGIDDKTLEEWVDA